MKTKGDALNLPSFWELPDKVWRNITKYDFRFYYQSGCTCTKNEAHQAYSHDIKNLLKKLKVDSNSYKSLKSCETVLKSAHNNHANKYFWDHEINKISKIFSDELFAEKELEVMEKMTAITALYSYNNKKSSKIGNSLQQDLSDDLHKDQEEYITLKRKQETEAVDIVTTPTKRHNQQETLSEKFMQYKQNIIRDAATKAEFSLETSLPELIALSNVMLLKPMQFTRYTRKHFGDKVLGEWLKNTLDSLVTNVEKEALRISKSLEDIIYDFQKKKMKTREVVQKLVAMSAGKEDYEAQILIGLSNLVQKLPHVNLVSTTNMSETELWSGVFDPILSALFSDPDRNTLLRWTNAVPDIGAASEVIRVQPDAIICEIDQLSWGCTLGYGEAKLSEPNPNIGSLANDLLRLATMTAKAVGTSELRSVFAFQIHGHNLVVYVTQKVPDSSFYTMTEAFKIAFPKSLEELDSFTSRRNLETLISLYKTFWKNCETKPEGAEQSMPESPGFDISTIQSIKDGSTDRWRECLLKY